MNQNTIKSGSASNYDDSGNLRFIEASYLDKKDQRVNAFMPYGIFCSPPEKSKAYVLQVNGMENNQFALIDNPKMRPIKDLNSGTGEFGVANFVTKCYIFFDKDNNIIIRHSSGSEIVLNDSGDIVLSPSSGTVRVNGDIDISGIIKGANVFNGSDSDQHRHAQGNDSDGDSEVDTEPPK
jgi:hypothetical protein